MDKKGKIMETKQMIRIEYIEPGVRVKELRRRRCVVAYSGNTSYGPTVGTSDYVYDANAEYESEDL